MAIAKNAKVCHLIHIVDVTRLPASVITRSKSFQLREKSLTDFVDDFTHINAVPTGNQASVAGHYIHEATKSEFHRSEVFINIRMVELDVVDDGDFGQIVHELRALIKVSGVVFIAFDDKVLTVRDAEAGAEILHDAADQETRIEPTLIHHPGRQTGSRGLAVSTGDHQRASSANEFFFDHFRQGTI